MSSATTHPDRSAIDKSLTPRITHAYSEVGSLTKGLVNPHGGAVLRGASLAVHRPWPRMARRLRPPNNAGYVMEDVISSSVDPYYDHPEGFTLIQGNSLELLPDFSNEQVDMVFADPPYFLSNDGVTCENGEMVSVNKGRWDRSEGIQANHEFNLKWLEACQDLLVPDGSLWVSGTQHIIYSLGFALQSLDYKILNDIAWFKVNPPPNLSCRYFTHGTETLIWAARDHDAKHTFNYERMKEMNGGKQMKNLWEIMSPRKAEKEHGKHPTQKPIKLLNRIVLAASEPGDVILDPFCGSSTTGLAAVRHGRRYIGIDQSDEYLDLSVDRFEDMLDDMEAQPELAAQ